MYLAISTAVACMTSVCVAAQLYRMSRALREERDLAAAYQQTAHNFERAAHDNQEALRRTQALLHDEKERNHYLLERCDKLVAALQESEDTACSLRQEVQTGRDKLQTAELDVASLEGRVDELVKELNHAEQECGTLKKERHKLNEALIHEKECAEHWREEFLKEQAFRLSTEGRIMREVNNLLAYDGTARGQEDVDA